MARRSRKSNEKVEIVGPSPPKGWDATHRFLRFQLTHTGEGSEDFHYIDIARHLSAINRRLYRQGMVYHIANVQVQDSQGACEFRFATLPNTWYFRKAWDLVFGAWKKQRAQLLDSASGVPAKTGKWSDFKVYINRDHMNDTDWPNYVDVENDATPYGEWNYADVTFTQNGTEYQEHAVHMMGGHSIGSAMSNETSTEDDDYDGSISAIKCFGEVWNQPRDNNPQTASAFADSVLLGMDLGIMGADESRDDMLAEIMNENDSAPYSDSTYPGTAGQAEDPWVVRETDLDGTGDTIAYVGGFPVPLGLLVIETESGTDGNIVNVTIEMAPGDYLGVAASPMWD